MTAPWPDPAVLGDDEAERLTDQCDDGADEDNDDTPSGGTA